MLRFGLSHGSMLVVSKIATTLLLIMGQGILVLVHVVGYVLLSTHFEALKKFSYKSGNYFCVQRL